MELSDFFFSFLDKDENPITTIIIRGSSENIMDDIERAVDDGVNTFKALTKVVYNCSFYVTGNLALIQCYII